MKTGIELIAAERERQITARGWTAAHDDAHDCFELIDAAMCYLSVSGPVSNGANIWNIKQYNLDVTTGQPQWPWSAELWIPSQNPVTNLVKAGALIAAEIDRLRRMEEPNAQDLEHANNMPLRLLEEKLEGIRDLDGNIYTPMSEEEIQTEKRQLEQTSPAMDCIEWIRIFRMRYDSCLDHGNIDGSEAVEYMFYAMWNGYGGECSKRWADILGIPVDDGSKVLHQEPPYEDLFGWLLSQNAYSPKTCQGNETHD